MNGVPFPGRTPFLRALTLAGSLVVGACASEPSAQRPVPTTGPTESPSPSAAPPLEPAASPQGGTPPPATLVAFQPSGGEPIGQLVVVDTATGSVVRILLDDVSHDEGGIWSPDLSPDGRTLYYAMSTSACTDDVRSLQLDVGVEEVIATEDARRPAVSPDGRLLAYVEGDFCFPEEQFVVVRDLAAGFKTRWRFRSSGSSGAGSEQISLRQLAWLPDSRILAYSIGNEEASSIYLLDTEGEQGIELGMGRRLGPRDSSLELVGFHAEGLAAVRRCFVPPEPGCPPGPEIVALDPETGKIVGTLLRPAPEAFDHDLDPSGRHLLYTEGRTLYRWSGGEPVKIGEGYSAPEW